MQHLQHMKAGSSGLQLDLHVLHLVFLSFLYQQNAASYNERTAEPKNGCFSEGLFEAFHQKPCRTHQTSWKTSSRSRNKGIRADSLGADANSLFYSLLLLLHHRTCPSPLGTSWREPSLSSPVSGNKWGSAPSKCVLVRLCARPNVLSVWPSLLLLLLPPKKSRINAHGHTHLLRVVTPWQITDMPSPAPVCVSGCGYQQPRTHTSTLPPTASVWQLPFLEELGKGGSKGG